MDSRAHCATRPIEHGVDRLLPSVFERERVRAPGEADVLGVVIRREFSLWGSRGSMEEVRGP